MIKPIEIDDVPILNIALYSATADTHALYRVAEEVAGRLQHVKDTARITIHGGEKRVVHVYLDHERLAAYGLSPMEIAGALKVSNAQGGAGGFEAGDTDFQVEAGPFLQNVDDVKNLMVGAHQGRPVYLRDVAKVEDGPAEVATYTRLGFGPGRAEAGGQTSGISGTGSHPAVTIAVAKKKGSNAVTVARDLEAAMAQGRSILPDDIDYRVTQTTARRPTRRSTTRHEPGEASSPSST